MSKHTFSVLTSDLQHDPSILEGIFDAARRRYPNEHLRAVEHGPVTTVTAVAA